LQMLGEKEVLIFGGQQLYELTLPLAYKIICTRVHGVFEVDTYFPAISEERFICEKQAFYPADENNAYAITFQTYVRK
jgi:dihydrofolate reductase